MYQPLDDVIDWKTSKVRNLSYFPSTQQRWQVQTYGYLLAKNGHDVKRVSLVAIARDGSVYASVQSDTTAGTVKGVYLVGNVSSATNIKTLTTGDRIIAFPLAFTPSAYAHCLGVDYAGNVLFADRSNEQIRCWGPQGNTSIEVGAPLSQDIEIAKLVSAKNWALYE